LKLSNNPFIVASRRLRLRKQTRDDEKVLFHHNAKVHLAPHTADASHIAGASSTAGASNMLGANTPLAAVAYMGTNATPGAGASASANINPGANGFASAIQPLGSTFLATTCANLRMLELKSNI
jgi:hypothetical protein